MKRKNLFLTFCFAWVPGFGQMYLGYMKRGVSLLFWCIAISGVSILLNAGVVMLLNIVVWAYAFFDTFNIRNLSEQQRAYFYDEYIPNRQWLAEHKLDRLFKPGNTARFGGWVCVIIGVLALWNNVVNRVVYPLYEIFPGLYRLVSTLPSLAIALGVILLGLWMIRRSKGTGGREDDVIPFGRSQNVSQNPADYMPPTNTPPAPWATGAQAPAYPDPPTEEPAMPEVELAVDDTIVLQTTTAADILNAPAEEAAPAEAAPAPLPEAPIEAEATPAEESKAPAKKPRAKNPTAKASAKSATTRKPRAKAKADDKAEEPTDG